MTSGTCPLSFVTQIFYNGQPSLGGEHKSMKKRNKRSEEKWTMNANWKTG
jgi:polyferredoxin